MAFSAIGVPTLRLRGDYIAVVTLALVALALAANVNLRDSRIGRAWIAMREDEAAAACAGVPIVRTQLMAHGTGAAFGGISGAFFASYLSFVNAGQFEFSFSIFIFAMVVLGGPGSIAGVVAGAIASGMFGAVLVIGTLPRPHGLVPVGRDAERLPPRDVVPASGFPGDPSPRPPW